MSRTSSPPWSTVASLHRDPLGRSLTTDVCVVGAGIAGLTVAYLLRREGLAVVVLEAGSIVYGQTGRTTAHLASAIDDGYVALERMHGAAGARAAADSHAAAIDRIEATVREEEIDCSFARVDVYLFSADRPAGDEADPSLVAEHDAARRAGLEVEAFARAPLAQLGAVRRRWSGQVMETSDGLAFIGRSPGDDDNVFLVSGDSGHGMTHGTIAGMLLCDLVQHRSSPWQEIYDPARIRLAAAGELLREGAAVARDYLAWLTPGDVSSADEIRPGDGAVLREGVAKVAAYRDDDGVLHRRSAVCPHLGCIVAWNGVERTCDCPCHGSRFDGRGRVVNGPANRDLAGVDRR